MRTAAAALALGFTLTAAGVASCAGPEGPGVPITPEPGVTPVYSSDEEALAAAEELYGRYYEFSNDLGASGWTDTAGMEELVAEDALADELETAKKLAAQGYRQVGKATFDSLTLQKLTDAGTGRVNLVFYACGDVTKVDVVDADGVSVVSTSRPDRQPVEVELNDAHGSLRIVRREPWTGSDFC